MRDLVIINYKQKMSSLTHIVSIFLAEISYKMTRSDCPAVVEYYVFCSVMCVEKP